MSAGQRTRRMNQPTAGKEALPGRGGVCYRRKARPIRRCSRSSCRTAASWRCTGCPHRGTGWEDRWLQDEIRTVRRPAAWTTWGCNAAFCHQRAAGDPDAVVGTNRFLVLLWLHVELLDPIDSLCVCVCVEKRPDPAGPTRGAISNLLLQSRSSDWSVQSGSPSQRRCASMQPPRSHLNWRSEQTGQSSSSLPSAHSGKPSQRQARGMQSISPVVQVNCSAEQVGGSETEKTVTHAYTPVAPPPSAPPTPSLTSAVQQVLQQHQVDRTGAARSSVQLGDADVGTASVVTGTRVVFCKSTGGTSIRELDRLGPRGRGGPAPYPGPAGPACGRRGWT